MSTAVGTRVTHTRYVAASDVHYAGNLAAGALTLTMFGDVATHLSILMDGHEGLFGGYHEVSFVAPVHGGDIVEIDATVQRVGTRSRTIAFEARILCRRVDEHGTSRALEEPLLATRAIGTVVCPRHRGDHDAG